ASLPLVFLLRWGLACVSYAAGTPGGLFAPMLVLGAQLGLLFGGLCRLVFPGLDVQPIAFAVVAMAAFFTGVVRAPLTGIVLVIEMTAASRCCCRCWRRASWRWQCRRCCTMRRSTNRCASARCAASCRRASEGLELSPLGTSPVAGDSAPARWDRRA